MAFDVNLDSAFNIVKIIAPADDGGDRCCPVSPRTRPFTSTCRETKQFLQLSGRQTYLQHLRLCQIKRKVMQSLQQLTSVTWGMVDIRACVLWLWAARSDELT